MYFIKQTNYFNKSFVFLWDSRYLAFKREVLFWSVGQPRKRMTVTVVGQKSDDKWERWQMVWVSFSSRDDKDKEKDEKWFGDNLRRVLTLSSLVCHLNWLFKWSRLCCHFVEKWCLRLIKCLKSLHSGSLKDCCVCYWLYLLLLLTCQLPSLTKPA